jgi:hypothetical protein
MGRRGLRVGQGELRLISFRRPAYSDALAELALRFIERGVNTGIANRTAANRTEGKWPMHAKRRE